MHPYKTDQINAVGQPRNQQNLFSTDYYFCDGVRLVLNYLRRDKGKATYGEGTYWI